MFINLQILLFLNEILHLQISMSLTATLKSFPQIHQLFLCRETFFFIFSVQLMIKERLEKKPQYFITCSKVNGSLTRAVKVAADYFSSSHDDDANHKKYEKLRSVLIEHILI